MNTPTPEQLAKLPKWAQEYINTIEIQRVVALRVVDQFKDEQTESKFYIQDQIFNASQSGPKTVKRYLQTNEVTFVIDTKLHKEITFRERHDAPGELDISGGFGGLRIQPQASNVIRVWCER